MSSTTLIYPLRLSMFDLPIAFIILQHIFLSLIKQHFILSLGYINRANRIPWSGVSFCQNPIIHSVHLYEESGINYVSVSLFQK